MMFPGTSLLSLNIIKTRLGGELSRLVALCAKQFSLPNKVKARMAGRTGPDCLMASGKKCRAKFKCRLVYRSDFLIRTNPVQIWIVSKTIQTAPKQL
jgi:hypothetical protein